MGRSLTESRRGATLYSASWPRGRPPERSAQRCGGRLPPTSKRSRGASGHFAPSAVAASAAVVAQPAAAIAQPAAAIAVSATAVSVATTAAVAEPAAAAAAALAVAAFAVAPPRRAEVEKASPPATLVMSLAERPQLHGLIPRDVDACRAIVAEQTERIARMVNGF